MNGIDSILGALNSGASSLETVLNTALTVLDAAKVLYLASADPFSFLFEALLSEIENLINDIFNSSVGVLVVNPFQVGREQIAEKIEGEILDTAKPFVFSEMQAQVNNKNVAFSVDTAGIPQLTPSECVDYMINSFDDEGDAERPEFSSSARVSAFGAIVTAPDIQGFLPLLSGLLNVLNLKPFADLYNDILRKANVDDAGQTVNRPASSQPDWTSAKLSSIDALSKQRDQLLRSLNLVRGFVQTADQAIVSLIDTISRKVENLLDIVEEFNELIESLRAIANASGIWAFSIPSATGGNDYLKERLRVSAADPSNPNINLFSLDSGYSAGVLFVGGGPSLVAVETIRELMFSTAEVLTGKFFDEIQNILFSEVPNLGTFRLEFNGEETVNLAFDAEAPDVETALNNLESLSDVEVQGDFTEGFTVRFTGSDGQKDQPDITTYDPGSNEVQKVSFTAKPDEGLFKLRYNPGGGAAIQESPAINNDATAATVQAALEAIPGFGAGNVAVEGSFSSGFTITWLNALATTEIMVLTFSSTLKSQNRNVGVSVARQAKGRAAASNLFAGVIPVQITHLTSRQGKSI